MSQNSGAGRASRARWLEVDNNEAILFQMSNQFGPNGDPVYRIGFRCWVSVEASSNEEWVAALDQLKNEEREITIMWPMDVNVSNAKITLKALANTKPAPVFESKVAKILSHGDYLGMTKKLAYVIKSGKTTPSRKDRHVLAKKRPFLDDEGENEKAKATRARCQSKKKTVKRSEAEKLAALQKLDAARSKRKALTELKENEYRDESSPSTLAPKSRCDKSPATKSVNNRKNGDDMAEENVYENVINSWKNSIESEDEEFSPSQSKKRKKNFVVEEESGDNNDEVLAKAISNLDEEGSSSLRNSFNHKRLASDLKLAAHLPNRGCNAPVSTGNMSFPSSALSEPSSNLIASVINSKEVTGNADDLLVNRKSNIIDKSCEKPGSSRTEREEEVLGNENLARDYSYNEGISSSGIAECVNGRCGILRNSGDVRVNHEEQNAVMHDSINDVVVQSVVADSGKENFPLQNDSSRQVNLPSDPSNGSQHEDEETLSNLPNVLKTCASQSTGDLSAPSAVALQTYDETSDQGTAISNVTRNEKVQAQVNVDGVESDATKSAEELIEELQRTRDELGKTREELSVVRKTLKLRESQLAKLGNQFEEFEKGLHNAIKKGCRPLRACMEIIEDSEALEMVSSDSTLNPTADDTISPEQVNGAGISKRKRKRKQNPSDESAGPAKKQRKKFPVDTEYELDRKIMCIVDNKNLTIKKVANESLPELFSPEELGKCCLFGTRKLNQGPPNESQRPPLDQERLGALLNRCWRRFGTKSSWYNDFKEAAKKKMVQYRSRYELSIENERDA